MESRDEIMCMIELGEKHRHIGETVANRDSSRSHTILRYTRKKGKILKYLAWPIRGCFCRSLALERQSASDARNIRRSVLNLVDLAGK